MNKKTVSRLNIEAYLFKILIFGGIALFVDFIYFIPLKTALTTGQLDLFLIGTPLSFIIGGILSELTNRIPIPTGTKKPLLAYKLTLGISIIGAFILLYPSQLFRNLHITAAVVSAITGFLVGTSIFSLFHLGGIMTKNMVAGCALTILLVACIYFYLYVITLGGSLLLLLFIGLMGFGIGSK